MLAEALERMPHTGRMRLIAEVREASPERILCHGGDHHDPGYPLRLDGRLAPVSMIELGAQAAAAHASLFGIGGAHIGLLLALRAVRLAGAEPDALAPPLEATAERMGETPDGAHYRFRVGKGDDAVIEGEAFLSIRALAR